MGDSFHVRHQAKPELIELVINCIDNNISDNDGLEESIRNQGYTTGTISEQILRLRKLGLLERDGLQLSSKGKLCAEILKRQHSLFYDLIHFYHYSLWDKKNPEVNRFSWTYRNVCKNLWNNPTLKSDTRSLLDRVIMDLINEFPGEEDISLSINTINGVFHWLEVLEPKVFENGDFVYRSYVPPELAVLAIQNIYNSNDIAYGELIALDEDMLNELAITCLVDRNVIDMVLQEALIRFDCLDLNRGWGYFIRLKEEPNLLKGL